jgi:hypothetical protein
MIVTIMNNSCQIDHIYTVAYPQRFKMKMRNKIATFLHLIILVVKKGIIKSIEHAIEIFTESELKKTCKKNNNVIKPLDLHKGDKVRVKSKNEIYDTLDKTHRFEGCAFMDEMSNYCDTEQIVYKQVNFFFDERLCKFFKAKGVVLLDEVKCSGKLSLTGPTCDRSCYFFWKDVWLEKI